MGIGQGYFLLVIVSVYFLAFGSFDSAYAIDYVLSAATCMGAPLGDGIWNGLTSTCTKPSTLTIIGTDTLIIPNDVTLALSTDFNLINQGGIVNFGTITIAGTSNDEGQLRNEGTASISNFGTITITGISEQSGWFLNQNSAMLINSGTITIDGINFNSGQLRNINSANIENSGKITITGINDVSGLVLNGSVLTNTGSIIITFNIDNTGGFIFNDCGEITFSIIIGNEIENVPFLNCIFGTSNAYEDPTIGKSNAGKQVVENGICIDVKCWTVTEHYHQDFELVEMLSDSTHTITTTVFCHNGVYKCNYVAFGISPYGTNINESVWKIILQKDHLDNWTMKVIDPNGFLGEVTSATQIVSDARYLSASATIEFKKPTPGMILNIEVRDSNGGYRDFKFNDGVAIVDVYAYPSIETSYELPLVIKPLCLNENSNKRYTCAFDMIRDWTIKNAEDTLQEINK
ncbi:MAG TPA: hypothetical protein VLA01_03645 [Nitrosopumilaceae archaeon]|nr:hypothetical protein [Nitrosopumilaceae archaeon]